MHNAMEFRGWGKITAGDLLVAYRKAKADCFYENTFPTAAKFAEFEANLIPNIENLLRNLQRVPADGFPQQYLGEYRLYPKKLSLENKVSATSCGHVHFSNSERAFDKISKNKKVVPELRIIGDFPVEAHVISALWINCIGRKIDANLSDCCYGARLRRVRADEAGLDDAKEFHYRAAGSFPPYFSAYQRWRSEGFGAIRRELENGKKVVASSLDLKSYYHFIDPAAISLDNFLSTVEVSLGKEEREFNAHFANFLCLWSNGAEEYAKSLGMTGVKGGLVIGLTASRVISNAMLHRWDKLIIENLAPLHYGRYVDDMFLVLRDGGVIEDGVKLLEHIRDRIGGDVLRQCKVNPNTWTIHMGDAIQGNSTVTLQADKQKLFILEGSSGMDLLESIESDMFELSSEHRLMPSPDQIEASPAAKVLSAAGAVGDSADNLRRADGLTIRRLSWALQLRHVETLAKDLPPSEWYEQRMRFYDFAENHILRPDALFSHFNYLPRLLGFAVSLGEWSKAEQVAAKSYGAIDELRKKVVAGELIRVNGSDALCSDDAWAQVVRTLTIQFVDAAARYYDPAKLGSGGSSREKRLARIFLVATSGRSAGLTLPGRAISDGAVEPKNFYMSAQMVALCDLAKQPYKVILRNKGASSLFQHRAEQDESLVIESLEDSGLFRVDDLKEFLESTEARRLKIFKGKKKLRESYFPYVFPTRPLTPIEISELAPECVGLPDSSGNVLEAAPSVLWARYTQALRGVWVKPTLLAVEMDTQAAPAVSGEGRTRKSPRKYVRIGTGAKRDAVVALPSIKTSDSDWAAMASGKPSLSRSRYGAISEIVNSAIKLKPRPDYLFLPELSLPIEWVDSVASRLMQSGISLVAGTEYRHLYKNRVYSEACLVLTDNRMGFPSSVRIWQPKIQPAVHEEYELLSKFGKEWARFRSPEARKPVYVHNGFHFGVMVCSELQNSRERIAYQGRVDSLIVLSWNPDLETFSSLVESAALDVHAYTVLVNNRTYGDSRVRVPAKQAYNRDLARVRGGDNDFLVAARLDITSLRSFQSRAKRWPEKADKFKPVPEGFRLAKSRRRTPS